MLGLPTHSSPISPAAQSAPSWLTQFQKFMPWVNIASLGWPVVHDRTGCCGLGRFGRLADAIVTRRVDLSRLTSNPLKTYQPVGTVQAIVANTQQISPQRQSAKQVLLNAALNLIRAKGYTATMVDDLCHAAGVTKGAFFHHFASKEALAVAAADHWSATTGNLFEHAPYHALADAHQRVLGYLDLRTALLQGKVADFTCLVGTMVQEVHDSSPAIRDACARSITGHAATDRKSVV